MKKTFSLLILLLVLGACQAQNKNTELVPVATFESRIAKGNVQLIDVRTPKEFKSGHLKNATNIHLYDQDFESQIEKLNKKETVYVYCKAGGRSAEAVEILEQHGFEKIVELEGGTDSWKTNNKPLVQ